ncbi:MAG TPA: Stp1/IreP family PP2C-type Ser/Thr phosphatase [Tissierellaceae bacterium]|nr:Stp1/IreP family PP2C-type Ser/Thr phosphatase [Tissierellaceae bacterium]
MVSGAISDIGKNREKNQDAYYASSDRDFPLYFVADGMGGHRSGEVASTMAMDIIKNEFLLFKSNLNKEKNILKVIKESIEKANTKIYLKSIESEECNGMGTTITLGYIFESKIFIGHVGDSRAYLIRDKEIFQITEDHSYVNELLKLGSISIEEAKKHPKKNMITRAVGSSSTISMDLIVKEYEEDDILLLCSDGLFNMLSEREIYEVFNREKNLQKACEILVKKANENGGLDNITLVSIKFN